MGDAYKIWYDEAMVASNEAGFAGASAAQTIRELSAQLQKALALPPGVEPVKAVVVHVGSNGTATHLPAREYLTRATVLQAVVAARASVASPAGLQLDAGAKALAKCRNLPWDLITPNHREQLRRDVTTVLEAMQALEP